jgi:putative membrane protein insertion efficiency factor
MTKLLIKFKINLIKMYRYILSPLLGNNCRYLTPCSEYYIESLKKFGLLKGSYIGMKRVLSCHPIKLLGGGSSLDFLPDTNTIKKENSNG